MKLLNQLELEKQSEMKEGFPMMEANELMTGALVYFNCFDGSKIVVRVTGFKDGIVYGDSKKGSHWCNIEKVEPIPITPEILEKNGWVYNNEDEKFFPETWVGGGLMLLDADDCGYRIVVTSDYDDEDTNYTPFAILYVHELQHALLLRRIKKEIVMDF